MKHNQQYLREKDAIPGYLSEKGRIVIYLIGLYNLFTVLGLHIVNIHGVKQLAKIYNLSLIHI